MSLVRIEQVARFYGARKLFGPLDLTIEAGDRIGFIGRNGTGKTSLLRLIAGVDTPDEGRIHRAARAQIGYLAQEAGLPAGDTPYEIVLGALQHLTALAQEMRHIEAEMAAGGEGDAMDAAMARYATVSERFERQGGYEADAKVRAGLLGLGLAETDLHRPVATLSGGQRARAALARLLVAEPDLLILDEPTNHLDLEATQWLEQFLRTYAGSLLVVSHDRYFLDAVTNRIWELDEVEGVTAYRGNYTAAQAQREANRERRLREYEAQQAEIERLEEYVRRYKAGNRSTMAKSREKRLARMERAQRPAEEGAGMRLAFAPPARGSREVVRLEAVTHQYDGGQPVLVEFGATLERGDRIGILGPNGSGKSTLLQLVSGRMQPSRGAVFHGRDIHVGYYAQEIEDFDPGHAVIDEILSVRHMTTPEARSYLARFLFRGDEVFKSVRVLSGGEKRRLMLAKLLLSPANLLCLDEPTNHLDISAREALEESLQTYEGTLVLVTHDRYFLSQLATKLIVLTADRRWEVFSGGYEAYVEAQKRRLTEAQEAERPARERRGAGPGRARPRQAVRPDEIAELEALIERLEAEKAALEGALADPALYDDPDRARSTSQRYQELTDEVERAYQDWSQKASAAES